MKSITMIQRAFQDPAEWLVFLKMMNVLFPHSKIEAIHNSCTAAVAMALLGLKQTYGYSFSDLYSDALEVFSAPAPLRLSPLVNLTTFDTFVISLELIEARLEVLTAVLKLDQLCTTH